MTSRPMKRADLAHHQHRLAADAIRDAAEQRAGDELTDREDRHQQRRLERRGAEVLGVDRQQRDDQREREDVDEDDEKDRQQHWWTARRCWRPALISCRVQSLNRPARPIASAAVAAVRRAASATPAGHWRETTPRTLPRPDPAPAELVVAAASWRHATPVRSPAEDGRVELPPRGTDRTGMWDSAVPAETAPARYQHARQRAGSYDVRADSLCGITGRL